MRKLVLGSLVAVLVASAAWLWSERGSRAGELLVPHAKTAQRERTSPLVEPPPETVERREVESTSPVAEPVQSSSTVQVVPEPVFHGRVVDALRQNPIAGARLHLGEGPLRFVGGTRTLDPPVRIGAATMGSPPTVMPLNAMPLW